MTDPQVLLLSHTQEPLCTDWVASALRARGAVPLRMDTDTFPTGQPLSATLQAADAETLLWNGEPLRVSAVWLWRLWPARLDTRLGAQHAAAAQHESAVTLRGMLDLLEGVPWIDAVEVNQAAGNKTRQLRLAQAVGLVIPPTLITNDAAAARQFYIAQQGSVIAKLQTSLTYGMQGTGGLPTRLISAADLDALDGLRHCPMIFQRYVRKGYELRIAWVDGHAFVGALDGKKCGVDWRYECTARWQPYTLPAALQSKLGRLMALLGLRQGAIDLIVTPEGEYVFLEVNPSGEWGMLQAELELPIAAAIAEALLAPLNGHQHPADLSK